jgi:hypothetical protein
LSYKLGVQGKKIEEIRDLSDREYQNFKKSSDCLFDFSRDQQLYAIVLLNYDDFLGTLGNYFQKYAENKGAMTVILMERIVLNIDRCLLNFLFSIRIFLDHTQTKLAKTCGVRSDKFISFKEACSKAYDNSFSYRFLAKLRNYSQHCGMPLGKLTLSSKENPPYSGIVSHSMEVKFNRNELLNYDGWGTRIQK